MPTPSPPPSPYAARSAWRFFPHALIGALLFVVAVNGGMIWSALATFPGVAQTDVFDHSNRYDAVLRQAALESALGWTLRVTASADGLTVALVDRDGGALAGAIVTAEARRPLGPDLRTTLAFGEAAPGRYRAASALPAPGQWDLRLAVTHGADVLHATRRVTAR